MCVFYYTKFEELKKCHLLALCIGKLSFGVMASIESCQGHIWKLLLGVSKEMSQPNLTIVQEAQKPLTSHIFKRKPW